MLLNSGNIYPIKNLTDFPLLFMLKDSHFINKIIKITYKRGGQLYAIANLIKKNFPNETT